MIHDNVEQITN